MGVERTLILCKPDAVQRGLVGQIIGRFEQKGLRIVGLKMIRIDEDLASCHYAAHLDKAFYPRLRDFVTSSPSVALAIEGEEAILVARRLIGKTNAVEAEPGTIRGDFGLNPTMNLVHGSDSSASAARELALFFSEEELHDYEHTLDVWV